MENKIFYDDKLNTIYCLVYILPDSINNQNLCDFYYIYKIYFNINNINDKKNFYYEKYLTLNSNCFFYKSEIFFDNKTEIYYFNKENIMKKMKILS